MDHGFLVIRTKQKNTKQQSFLYQTWTGLWSNMQQKIVWEMSSENIVPALSEKIHWKDRHKIKRSVKHMETFSKILVHAFR